MFNKYLMIVLSMLVVAGCSSDSDEPFQEGTHYRVLSQYPASQTKQVAMFFSSACPHCYAFDETLETWTKSKPEGVVLERIPVLFNQPTWLSLVRLYATMRVMGIQEEMSLKMFDAVQKKRLFLGDGPSVAAWLATEGYDSNLVQQVYASQDVDDLMDNYSLTEQRYAIRSIPRVIINGNIEIIPKSIKADTDEGSAQNLSELINYVLTK